MELPQDRKVQEKYSGREAKVENPGAAACGRKYRFIILSLPAGFALVSIALGAWSTSLSLCFLKWSRKYQKVVLPILQPLIFLLLIPSLITSVLSPSSLLSLLFTFSLLPQLRT